MVVVWLVLNTSFFVAGAALATMLRALGAPCAPVLCEPIPRPLPSRAIWQPPATPPSFLAPPQPPHTGLAAQVAPLPTGSPSPRRSISASSFEISAGSGSGGGGDDFTDTSTTGHVPPAKLSLPPAPAPPPLSPFLFASSSAGPATSSASDTAMVPGIAGPLQQPPPTPLGSTPSPSCPELSPASLPPASAPLRAGVGDPGPPSSRRSLLAVHAGTAEANEPAAAHSVRVTRLAVAFGSCGGLGGRALGRAAHLALVEDWVTVMQLAWHWRGVL